MQFPIKYAFMAMEMDKIELMVELQVFTHIHDQRAVHRQFIPGFSTILLSCVYPRHEGLVCA